MKNIILFLALISSNYIVAQNYLDKITDKTCDCLKELKEDDDKETRTASFGLCIIDAAKEHKKELKKEHSIDFDKLDRDGEKLGELIGEKVAVKCPDLLLKVFKDQKAVAGKEAEAEEELVIEKGNILAADKQSYVTFKIKNEAGKETKIIWLIGVKTEYDIVNKYAELVGKDVEIGYTNLELFDHKSGEYRNFKVLQKLDLVK